MENKEEEKMTPPITPPPLPDIVIPSAVVDLILYGIMTALFLYAMYKWRKSLKREFSNLVLLAYTFDFLEEHELREKFDKGLEDWARKNARRFGFKPPPETPAKHDEKS